MENERALIENFLLASFAPFGLANYNDPVSLLLCID
jgi:hypothetical protein